MPCSNAKALFALRLNSACSAACHSRRTSIRKPHSATRTAPPMGPTCLRTGSSSTSSASGSSLTELQEWRRKREQRAWQRRDGVLARVSLSLSVCVMCVWCVVCVCVRVSGELRLGGGEGYLRIVGLEHLLPQGAAQPHFQVGRDQELHLCLRRLGSCGPVFRFGQSHTLALTHHSSSPSAERPFSPNGADPNPDPSP